MGKSRKSVVVLYTRDDWHEVLPMKNSEDTRLSFEELYVYAEQQNVDMYRASIAWFQTDTGVFSKAWAFKNNAWEKVAGPIRVDAIYDKTTSRRDYQFFAQKMEITKHARMVNSPLFRTLFDNKLAQYLAFPEFMPLSFLAHDRSELKKAAAQIPSSKIVMKQLYGSGGKQVVIEEKDNLSSEIPYPVLVQEFVPTSGVPGFSNKDEVADLRLVYMNHRLLYSLSRIAKKGSLFTNFHQGAEAVLVPEEKIPEKCLALAQKIQEKLFLFSNTHYSLDFMFTKEGEPFFIEMNTTPGFDLLRLVGNAEMRENHHKNLLALLLSL